MNYYPWFDEYLLAKPGAAKDYKEEWGWDRYLVSDKMFAATCQPGPEHKDYDCRQLLTLKCEPALSELLRAEYPDIVPGFYMDKRTGSPSSWMGPCRKKSCGTYATAPTSWSSPSSRRRNSGNCWGKRKSYA